ncbi:MAG: hypothetical protein K2X80_15120 [Pseudomonadaceae bacterium]|nr:hypothetical protein [Pseudomonadaceae bacterium]
MSKILKWGLLAILALGLLIKVSLWLSVRAVMNDAIAQLAPVMDISYGSITSSFDGRVGLNKVEIRIPALHDSVRVASAELKFHGLGELLSFKERLAEGKFPEQLAISLKGLALDVHGPLMVQLYDQPAERSVLTAMSEVACGKVSSIGTSELLDMGYRTFETDAEFSYQFQPGAQRLSFRLVSTTRDMAEMRVGMTLANMSEKPGDLIVNPPRLALVTVEIDDNQYQRKVQDYCAGKLGQDRERYLQTALEKVDQVLRSQRIALDQPVLAAYAGYLKDPQSLRLELNPTEGMAWDGLEFFAAKDVLAMLRPVLSINQKQVEPLSFTWLDNKAHQQEDAAVEPRAAVTQAPVPDAHIEYVAVNELANYAGKRVQLITFDGQGYSGLLRKVDNGKVYLTLLGSGGSADISLRLDKVHQVRILF